MRKLLMILLIASLGAGVGGCQSLTGKTLGRNIDDATITASVKTRLATDAPVGAVTGVDVDTENGIVYLTGVVRNEVDRRRVAKIARDVDGVVRVVNHLQTRTGAADAPSYRYRHDR